MGTLPEVIPKDEVKEHSSTIVALKEQMSAIKVTSQEELTTVAGHIASVKKVKKVLEGVRDKYINPAKEIIAMAKGQFGPMIEACDEIEENLKGKAAIFIQKEEKRVKEQEARELAKVDSGYQKEDTATQKIAEIPDAVKNAKIEDGNLSGRKVKKVVIVDQNLIPEEYYKPRELDMVKIKRVATAGVSIPGVRVDEELEMQFRAS